MQEAKSALTELGEDAENKDLPRALAGEAPSPQTADEALAEAAAPGARDEQDVLPTAALEVDIGGLLGMLALITLFATWRLRRHRAVL